jgi:peptide-methionine (R)-S-oxide reductase
MKRRQFLQQCIGLSLGSLLSTPILASKATSATFERTDKQWRQILTAEQYHILREEGTEASGSSPLNHEKRSGHYHCVGCDQPLFSSEMKYDSGTGWPSFYTSLPNAFETKLDFKLIYPRTEYHCSRCGGHHGHVFNDGPEPTGKRWCNNGVALRFIPSKA